MATAMNKSLRMNKAPWGIARISLSIDLISGLETGKQSNIDRKNSNEGCSELNRID